jgi:hypothetical protein
MSFLAPLTAAFIHSIFVFQGGLRFYNAEIGGIYFLCNEGQSSLRAIILLVVVCGVPAIPTFFVLIPFKKRALYRWVVWIGFVMLWTWFYFQTEIALK